MTKTFIQTKEFSRNWDELGFTDVDFVIQEAIYLITVYIKSEKDNLTKKECSDIKKSIELLEQSLNKEENTK